MEFRCCPPAIAADPRGAVVLVGWAPAIVLLRSSLAGACACDAVRENHRVRKLLGPAAYEIIWRTVLLRTTTEPTLLHLIEEDRGWILNNLLGCGLLGLHPILCSAGSSRMTAAPQQLHLATAVGALTVCWIRGRTTASTHSKKRRANASAPRNFARRDARGVVRLYCRNRFTWTTGFRINDLELGFTQFA